MLLLCSAMLQSYFSIIFVVTFMSAQITDSTFIVTTYCLLQLFLTKSGASVGTTHECRREATKRTATKHSTRAGMDSAECKGTAEEGKGILLQFFLSLSIFKFKKFIIFLGNKNKYLECLDGDSCFRRIAFY